MKRTAIPSDKSTRGSVTHADHAKQRPSSTVRPAAWIHSTRLHVVLYSVLLVATPLVMLRSFLQQAISKLSDFHFELGGMSFPTMLTLASVVGVAILIWQRRAITKWRVIAVVIVLLMDALAQQITDYYSHHRFYDLQQNWHYVAYGLFSYMMYRDLAPRGVPLQRILVITFGCALLYSTFDEAFQKFINTRVFDISDIAKDTYGSVAGMVLISLGGRQAGAFFKQRRLRYRRLSEYFQYPFSTLTLIFVFSLLLLMTGSLLSDAPLFLTAVLIAGGAFLVAWLLFHVTQFKVARFVLLSLLVAAAAAQTYSYLRFRHDGVVLNRHGLTIYKGIPIPFFDVMIFADGSFRLVDKKHEFNYSDRMFFLKQRPDILLIGSGALGRGGNGFPSTKPSQFIYNPFTQHGTHVIILRSDDASATFNRLKKEHKNVLFVLHSTC